MKINLTKEQIKKLGDHWLQTRDELKVGAQIYIDGELKGIISVIEKRIHLCWERKWYFTLNFPVVKIENCEGQYEYKYFTKISEITWFDNPREETITAIEIKGE